MTHSNELNIFSRAYNWLTLNDYFIAKEEATDLLVRRLSRGNTSTQNGWYFDWVDLVNLSKAGDRAMRKLLRTVSQ